MADELLVGHRVPLAQREQLVEPEAREVGCLGRRKIDAARLDPQHPLLAAEMIALEQLARGVAAAVQDEAAVGADQARALDEPGEPGAEVGRRRVAHHAGGPAR